MTDDVEQPAEAEVVVIGEPDGSAAADPVPSDPGHASLLAIVDRLGGMLERSDLTEIEVEVGGTAVVLRKPTVIAHAAPVAAAASASAPAGIGAPTTDPAPAAPPARPSVKAPLTGIWYGSPAPGSAPFVEAGREIAIGQVVGLIEAMKLFNEIKSDLAGRVVRVVPESGALVKAKQPLIEVEPL
ncbi:MAG TPA: biotin/lipoyl-containing protein [Candidatus Limnocylindrales bacterium]|jgi:acetyl-CoA carboxylase biotin carboxyl carrier protein|nr:biotin/lipoyl-containing protein [Candidatus Limnocylindrales bacterium]